MSRYTLCRCVVFAFLVSILVSSQVYSAGYLEFDSQGTPYKWNSPITYTIDDGGLGLLTEVQADAVVTQAFSNWDNVPNTALTFVDSGSDAPVNITSSNVNTYVNFNGTSCPIPDFVVVYDSDGQIFSNLFGSASSGILGVASPSVLVNSTKKITCGYALVNGDAVSSTDAMLYTLMHELGHGFNLEHSQINEALIGDASTSNDEFIPLMYPVIPSGLTEALAGGINGIKLDDQFSIHALYNPAFLATEGGIQGTVKYKNEQGVLGANVICYDKNNPEENAVSWVSGSSLQGDGKYVCGHLPAGDYQVKIEPITKAINQWDQGTPPFIPTEYFNGDNESSSASVDLLSEKSDIAVGTTTISNVNLLINDNGQMTSGKKVTGTISPSSAADIEYYIYVPKSVKKATFELTSSPSGVDVDVYGRCNSPFSLSLDTAGPIYNPTAPQTQQADFAGANSSGNETVKLDASSSPKIQNCQYHFLLINYDNNSDASFELTATLEGNTPKLKTDFSPEKSVQSNGETLVSIATLEAQDDQFTIDSIKFTDTGILPLSTVSLISVYEDKNNNGHVDSADLLLQTTTSLDSQNRTFTMNHLNIFIDEGKQKQILITYTMPVASSSLLLFTIVLMGIVMALLMKPKGHTAILLCISMLLLSQCTGGSDHDFNPTVSQATDLKAQASGFGNQYTLKVGKPKTLKEVFE